MRKASTYTFTVHNRVGIRLFKEDRTYTGEVWQRQACITRRTNQLMKKFRDEQWLEVECKRTDADLT